MTHDALRDATRGRFDRWWWCAGLDVEAVAAALDVELSPGRSTLGGRPVQQAVTHVPGQPYRVRLRWELDGELALVELMEPAADPSWDVVLDALGEPTDVLPRGRGPFPGADQRLHLDRGLTVFDAGGLGIQAVWLFPPTSIDAYPGRTGALEPVRRTPRRRR